MTATRDPQTGRFLRGAVSLSPANAPKRTPAVVAKILEGIAEGLPRGDAAQCAGISRRTLYYWAEDDAAFADQLDFAESQAKRSALTTVRSSSLGWQSAAWLLERRWPNEFGQKSRLDVSLETTEYAEERARKMGLTVEELMARAEALGVAIAPSGTHQS